MLILLHFTHGQSFTSADEDLLTVPYGLPLSVHEHLLSQRISLDVLQLSQIVLIRGCPIQSSLAVEIG